MLAGGKSSRMGRDKATLQFRGKPLIAHAVELLRAAGCRSVIAGLRPDLAAYAPVLPDLHPGCGPLSGIESALAAAHLAPATVLFLPVDLPLLPASFLTLLLERSTHTGALATIPVAGGRPQPLCAVFHTALLPGIREALKAGEYKVLRAIEAATSASQRDYFYVEAAISARSDLLNLERQPLHRWFLNVNTPEEWAGVDAPPDMLQK